jgi:transposase-like protein
VPQDRAGRFSTELFARYQRSAKALVAALAEMHVQGVSTRKVKAITEELCGHGFSAEGLAQFAGRRLDEGCPDLILDARYERVREAGVIRSQAVRLAIGIRLGPPAPGAGGRARQPREPLELARVSPAAARTRPVRRGVRGLG